MRFLAIAILFMAYLLVKIIEESKKIKYTDNMATLLNLIQYLFLFHAAGLIVVFGFFYMYIQYKVDNVEKITTITESRSSPEDFESISNQQIPNLNINSDLSSLNQQTGNHGSKRQGTRRSSNIKVVRTVISRSNTKEKNQTQL